MSNSPPSLQVSTSLSSASSSFSFASPPARQSTSTGCNGDETVADYLNRLKYYTPPADAGNLRVSELQSRTNTFLFPIGKSWNHLDEQQRAKMSFFVLRNQPFLLQEEAAVAGNSAKDVANIIYGALQEDGTYGKKLTAFVQKGGDDQVPPNVNGKNHLATFIAKYPEWGDSETAPTIFNHPDPFSQVEPCFRFQEADSTVCYLVSVANAIFYSMRLNTGTNHDESIMNYSLNIGRFMRNEFTNKEVYEYIFKSQGGYPTQAFTRLLGKSNQGVLDTDLTRAVSIDSPDLGLVFGNVKDGIRRFGALVVEKFKMFPAYENEHEHIFSGDWNDQPPENLVLHALLVVGVSYTKDENEMGGLKFLIQDSWERRPFFVVGYDLLSSMGVVKLLAVEPGLTFSTGAYNFPNSPHEIRSGISNISESEEPLENRFRLFDETTLADATCDSEGNVGEEATKKTPNYWMKIDPGAEIWSGVSCCTVRDGLNSRVGRSGFV